MVYTLQEFREQLIENSVLTEIELAAFLSGTESAPQTTHEFAKLLIRENKLTEFQAERILDGKGRSLTLGAYLLKDKLGRGGMGQVYLAEHVHMKREVALKVLSPRLVEHSVAVMRFHREIEAAAQLKHPNIVTAYDANEDHGVHFLVMEYVPGCDLAISIRKKGPFSIAQALDVIEQSATGLAYAHEKGIIHRDIKPSNLLLDESGTIKILDLGLARIKVLDNRPKQDDLTEPGMVIGTVDFMAPEQALDTHLANAVSDIYSLGCCLYYLLTGQSLFPGSNAIQRLFALQNHPAPSLAEVRPDVPAEVEAIYQKMIAKKPVNRFQSMNDVVEAVQLCRTTVGAHVSARESEFDEAHLLLYLDEALRNSSGGIFQGVTIPDPITQSTVPTESGGDTKSTISVETRAGFSSQQDQPPGSNRIKRILFRIFSTLAILLLLALVIDRLDTREKHTQSPDENNPRSGDTPPRSIPLSFAELDEQYALMFDGIDDWIQLPHMDLPPDSAFTIELWYQSPEIQKNETGVLVLLNSIISLKNTGRGNWRFVIADQGSDHIRGTLEQPQIVGRPVHLAAVYENHAMRLYIDGKRQQLQLTRLSVEGAVHKVEPFSGKINPRHSPRGSQSTIGGYEGRIQSDPTIRGRMSELRISKIARYSADFNPIPQFDLDKHVLALYHFAEGKGDLLADSSLSNHHGTIFGATWVNADGTPLASGDSQTDQLPHRERKAAEWVILNGGSVNLRGFAHRFTTLDELPNDEFEIYHVHLTSDGDLAPREFEHLAGLPKLEMVYLSGSEIDSTVISYLSKIPRLMLLQLGGTQLPSSALAPLKSLRRLHFLAVEGGESVDDDWEAVRELSSLRSITVFGGTPRDVLRLASIPHLRQIWLPRAESLDEEIIADLANLNPDCRLLIGREKETVQVLGRDPVKELALALSDREARLKLNEVGSGTSRQFDSPDVDQVFMLTILELPPNSRLEDSLRQKLNVADLSYFSSVGQQDADGLAAALVSQTLLTGVQFAKSDLTNEGLRQLSRCPSLAYLDVRQTQVTSAGIAAFQAAKPDCILFLDTKSTR